PSSFLLHCLYLASLPPSPTRRSPQRGWRAKNFTRYNKRWPYVAVPNAVTAPLDSSARWQLTFIAQNAPTTPKQPVMIVAPMVLTYIHYQATDASAAGTGPSGMPRMP